VGVPGAAGASAEAPQSGYRTKARVGTERGVAGGCAFRALFEIDLFFKAARGTGGPCPGHAYPPADLGGDLWQLFGSQHHEGQDGK